MLFIEIPFNFNFIVFILRASEFSKKYKLIIVCK